MEDEEYKALYRTNKQGFRIGVKNSFETEIKECDWLFLGDSFTQGAQVEYDQLYTSLLYKHFPDKIIINAGISGFGVPQEFQLLEDIGKKLKPKKVFLQLSGFNDFMNVEMESMGFSDYLMYYSDLARFLIYGLKYQNVDTLPLGRWTEPFCSTEKENIDYNIFYKRSSPKKEDDLKALRHYLELMNNEVKMIGADLIIILLPTKEQIYYKYLSEVIDNFHINPAELDLTYPNRILDDLTRSLNIEFIDLTLGCPEYPGNIFFERDEHLSSYGHFVIASILANEIHNKGIHDTNVKLLGSYSSGNRYPNYNNDGDKIIFQSLGESGYEIMMADPSFSNIRSITHNKIDEIHPTLDSTGELIAFTEGVQEDFTTKVAIISIDGTSRKDITNKHNQFGAIPSFSNNGNLIIFAQWYFDEKKSEFTLPQIVYSDLNGDNENIITSDDYESWRPIFSKNDQSIIYISKRNGNFDIFEYSILSKTKINLTNTPYDEWDPNMSSDGHRIIYAANKDGNWDLFIMNRNGSNRIQITFTQGDEWDPCFSPINNNIIYAGEFGFFGGIYQYSLETHPSLP